MSIPAPLTFSLPAFEGPLDLMWQLLHREELDILEISLTEIMRQFLQSRHSANKQGLDQSAEFISIAAILIWYKSKALLPDEALQEIPIQNELDEPFENIQYLVDYCIFKQAAKDLARLEERQELHYPRGKSPNFERKKNLGIEHLSLEDLNILFQQILQKSASHKGVVHEEEWRVGDKIKLFREIFAKQKSVLFTTIFVAMQCREELIVAFLALLELMKSGEIRVVKDLQTAQVFIQARV